ncbi:MAG TPA: SDR family oxidoreductase [Candidatus Thermoplasmatota archaeon]|nr:SDR family oxidoreductase [Candidatus Thermoplasmatota archaeon]
MAEDGDAGRTTHQRAASSPFRPDLFAGRTVAVTGGSSGIGLAIAQAFHAHGAEVHLLARDPARLAAAAATMPGSRTHAVDVRDPDRLEAAAAAVGPTDALVNAAAGNFPIPFDAMSRNAWQAVVSIVLDGTANACRAFRPRLRPGSTVTNIVAGYAWTGAPGVAHSGAAKAGVLNLTRSLAVEWAPVRVNAVSPGPIDGTEGMKRLADDLGLRAGIEAAVPLGRLGHAPEVAFACLYLASPAASYVTGACLVVDGGMDAMGPFGPLLGRLPATR